MEFCSGHFSTTFSQGGSHVTSSTNCNPGNAFTYPGFQHGTDVRYGKRVSGGVMRIAANGGAMDRISKIEIVDPGWLARAKQLRAGAIAGGE
jgi:hypothetical protein